MNEEMNKYEILNALLTARSYREFTATINEMNPIDVADYMDTLSEEMLIRAFRLLKKDVAAEVFAELSSTARDKIIVCTTDNDLAYIIEELFVDDAVDLLEELPAGMVKRILKASKPETRMLINKFLSYPDGSVGSIMTAEYTDLKKNMTAAEALEQIRKTGQNKETVYTTYVTNASRVLEGIVSLKDLMFADDDALVGDIMETDIISSLTTDDQETAAAIIAKYNFLALPVVDKEQRLVGIVTVDDAINVIHEEATEDIEMMAAISPTSKSYMETSTYETWKKRIPWLLILMLSATFTGSIITHYESALGAYVILTAFIPMIMNSGGNAGGQSSVTVIRGLSLGEIGMKDIIKVLFKEFKVAFLCALTLSVVNFIKVMIFDFRFGFNAENLLIAAIVSVTLFCTIVFAKLIGAALPILAKRIGLDPTVMASPFITTIVDALSLVIYFQFATTLLGI